MRHAVTLAPLVLFVACKGSTLTTSPGHLSVLAGSMDVSNGSDDFGQSCPGFPVQQLLSLSNTGDTAVNVKSLVISGDFSVSPAPTLPFEIGPGESTAITVTFAPTSGQTGGEAGTLTLTSDAENGTLTVNLTGTVASAPPTPTFVSTCLFSGQSRTPCSFLDFASTPIGSSSTQTLQIENNGCAPITESASIVQDGGPFTVGTVPASLPLGSPAQVTVTFAPTAPGDATAALIFATNDPQGGPGQPAGQFAVTLSGVAAASADLTLSPTSWAAPAGALVGQTFTVQNGGGSAIALDAPSVTEGDDAGVFALDAGWASGFVLDAGASVSCVVTSDLTGSGAFGATLVIPAGATQLTAALTTNAIAGLCSSNALTFDTGLLCGSAETETTQLFVCDGGNAPIEITSISVTPNPGSLYSLTLPSPSAGPWTVSPGDPGLTVSVAFQDDGTLQQADAQLVVASNALSQPTLNVPITNTPAYVPPANGVPVLVDGGPTTVGTQLLFQVQPTGAPNYAYQFYWVAQSSGATPPDAGLTVLTGVPGADVAFVPEVVTSGASGGYRLCVDELEVDAGFGNCGFDAGEGTGRSAGCSQVIVVGS